MKDAAAYMTGEEMDRFWDSLLDAKYDDKHRCGAEVERIGSTQIPCCGIEYDCADTLYFFRCPVHDVYWDDF